MSDFAEIRPQSLKANLIRRFQAESRQDRVAGAMIIRAINVKDEDDH